MTDRPADTFLANAADTLASVATIAAAQARAPRVRVVVTPSPGGHMLTLNGTGIGTICREFPTRDAAMAAWPDLYRTALARERPIPGPATRNPAEA